MRAAGGIVSHAMHTGIEAIEPGVRECDAIAKVYHAQISGTDGFWGDYTAAAPQTPTGAKTAAAHLTWTGEPYQADSVTYLELGGCHQRYHSALARTIYLGTPPPRMKEVADVTARALDLCVSGRPGPVVVAISSRPGLSF